MGVKVELKSAALKIYSDLVRGRTRVRVVSADDVRATSQPRFLLSPYRSGTTLLRYCLDSHPDLAVPPETDYLAPLLAVVEDEESLVGFADLGYDKEQVAKSLGRFGRSFLDTYAQGRGALGWLDKSPRYAEDPNAIKSAFPDAKYIVLHRHPLDQIHSITQGGSQVFYALRRHVDEGMRGKELVESAGRYWAQVTKGLIDFQECNPELVLTVRYEDLCREPSRVLSDVLNHLNLDWSDQVLEFYRHDHDRGRESGRVAGTRGFSLASGGWKSWEAGWAESVWAIVGPVSQSLGYQFEVEQQ